MSHLAVLKLNLESVRVDRDKGVVYGCKFANTGKVAVFADAKGAKRELLIRPELVDALLSLWQKEERGTAHWTHAWVSQGEGLDSVTATWRNFRKDDDGDLVADAFLWPTKYRDAILHAAENDPKGMMVSQVFDYTGGRDDAIPVSVRAADFVEIGASTVALLSSTQATTALFADATDQKSMDINELIEALKDPKVQAAVSAIIKEHKDDASESADAAESDAGVTDADKKPDDDKMPAALRASLRISRAALRQAKDAGKLTGEQETALLKRAEAAVVKNIGSNPAFRNIGEAKKTEPALCARLSAYIAAGESQGRAITLAKGKASSKEIQEWEDAGRPMPNKAA